MCIFSGAARVRDTEIFAALRGREQVLVYSMDVELANASAMVLPLPTVPDAPSATFVDLSAYTDFFRDLRRCFPLRRVTTTGRGRSSSTRLSQRTLAVERVGAFEASFVPRPEDWSRLDDRFRLAPDVADALADRYAHYSFAVFQLGAGAHRIHPMALRFTVAETHALYFPTVHVHDNTVPNFAEFDHHLYFQGKPTSLDQVEIGTRAPQTRMKLGPTDLTQGLVLPDDPAHRIELRGLLHNEDTWVSLSR